MKSDAEYLLNRVLELQEPAEIDFSWAEKQSGRFPEGVFRVKKCSSGFPQLLVCSPVIRKSPFPTTFWLTCPSLRLYADHLEQSGEIRRISEMISSDENLCRKYEKLTEVYISLREKIHDCCCSGFIYPESMRRKGIGGISNFRNGVNLKCIHLHLAFFLIYPEGFTGLPFNFEVNGSCTVRCIEN